MDAVAFSTTAGAEVDQVIVDADESGLGNFSFEHYTRPTIVRIVGRLTCQLNSSASSASVSIRMRYLLGIMCADEDKPAGRLDEEFGHSWMWMTAGTIHRPTFQNEIPVGNAAGTQNVVTTDYGKPLETHDIDIRTMRKVGRDCELRLVMHTQSITAFCAPHISGFLRCLIKE